MTDDLPEKIGDALTWAQNNTLSCLLLGAMVVLLAFLRVLRNRNQGGGT